MFFKKKKSYGLPLGMAIGALIGMIGTAAIASSNGAVRKIMKKELAKCGKCNFKVPGAELLFKQ